MAKITGCVVYEASSDIVPVVATRQARAARERSEKLRRQRSRAVAGVLGVMEADEESAIPDDAEPLEGITGPARQFPGMHDVEAVEPKVTDPYGSKEELMPPNVALVAPDVTPQATEPLDPSLIPGAEAEIFRARDVEQVETPPPKDVGRSANVNAMDVLLGRTAKGAQTLVPPSGSARPPMPAEAPTTEAAYRMVGATPPAQQLDEDIPGATGGAAVYAPMAEPAPHTDSKVVMEAFRSFNPV